MLQTRMRGHARLTRSIATLVVALAAVVTSADVQLRAQPTTTASLISIAPPGATCSAATRRSGW
jgi:hypothetical protein